MVGISSIPAVGRPRAYALTPNEGRCLNNALTIFCSGCIHFFTRRGLGLDTTSLFGYS
jgi:hypothetical protein